MKAYCFINNTRNNFIRTFTATPLNIRNRISPDDKGNEEGIFYTWNSRESLCFLEKFSVLQINKNYLALYYKWNKLFFQEYITIFEYICKYPEYNF